MNSAVISAAVGTVPWKFVTSAAKVTAELKKHTNFKDALPRAIYENIYCPRGDMENRIKDCQLDLFGDRASAHDYKANQLRLMLAGFAAAKLAENKLHKRSPGNVVRDAEMAAQKVLDAAESVSQSLDAKVE